MKSSTRKMVLLFILNVGMGGFVLAQNATGEKTATYTISGSVGLRGVTMQGLPGDPITDQKGRYSVTVESGWRGAVTPEKEGFSFHPRSISYAGVLSNRTTNYIAEPIHYMISGRVGLAGVEMQGLPGNVIADQRGYYSVALPYGWSGVVKPKKEGYTFMPPSKPYAKVIADLTNQDYAPRAADERMAGRYQDMYGGGYSSNRGRGRSTGYQPAISPVGSRKVLVVPVEEVKPEELAAITEDMQVMSFILDERFKETRRIQGVFIDFGDFFGRDNRQTEATYLQGYGVLFSMEVNFSFSPPPKPQAQEAEQPDAQVDSTWQRARQEVFSPQESPGRGMRASPDEYNSQMVEELKRDLITTLKHAANIRGLQPDEWVILTVIGTGRRFGRMGGMSMGGMGMGMMGGYGGSSSTGAGGYGAGSMGGYGGGGFGGSSSDGYGGGMVMGGMMGGMGGFSGTLADSVTVLTIRARKSDVDAFAGGELDFDQFREMVKTVMY